MERKMKAWNLSYYTETYIKHTKVVLGMDPLDVAEKLKEILPKNCDTVHFYSLGEIH